MFKEGESCSRCNLGSVMMCYAKIENCMLCLYDKVESLPFYESHLHSMEIMYNPSETVRRESLQVIICKGSENHTRVLRFTLPYI